ncbi:hypothetical protein [Fibrobacter sp. UWB10]|uniref:hypothetical protein n=1 Tax=Fibrobacter sp. UWB10 TaxID=1896201 RepID=UPI0024035737|nr:hypothetical protein [Fibrobacter sp. UWB10]SMP57642.1 hypothetical protein SAMN05720465_2714 [Fibrobacter sp. UWB10]
MKLKFFPDTEFFDPQKAKFEDLAGDVGKEQKGLSKRRPDLYLRVKSFLMALLNVVDILPYLKNEQMYKFQKDKEGLYEMRIPKQAHAGVFRIYFCFSITELQTLILLCAELKHKKEPMKLGNAVEKLKQYKELVKQGVML